MYNSKALPDGHDVDVSANRSSFLFLLQKCFNMSSTERDEVDEDCETLDAVESASEGFEYYDAELKLLVEKWSRYSVAYF